MLVVFRCDASVEVGSGHLMRCVALARQLRQSGAELLFICRALTDELTTIAQHVPATVVQLATRESGPCENGDADKNTSLACGQTLDAGETTAVLRDCHRPDWLVVDHYDLGAEWESAVKPYVRRILAIDDFSSRAHHVDALLDQNLAMDSADRYARLVPSSCELLLGPTFALLRPEFATVREKLRSTKDRAERILVSFGGFDPSNQTLKALHGIAASGIDIAGVDIVLDRRSPNRQQVAEYCRNEPHHELYGHTMEMARLMAGAKLAIGACGSTTWERCCVGLPTLGIALAENQAFIGRNCERAGVLEYLGLQSSVTAELIADRLERIWANSSRLKTMSYSGMALVDGHGTQRVCDYLLS